MSTGLGAQAATRPDTAIRNSAERLQELVGKSRQLVAELEQMRSRVTGHYNEEKDRERAPDNLNQPTEHRCDMDELNWQLNQLEDVLDQINRHVQELHSL
jgi:prefoldin subunit 5